MMQMEQKLEQVSTNNLKFKLSFGTYLWEYIKSIAFCEFMAFFFYRKALFRCVPNSSLNASLLILCGLNAICLLFGFLLHKKQQNGFTIACDIFLPFGIYTTITYWKNLHECIVPICVVSLCITFIFVISIFWKRIRRGDKRIRFTGKRFKKSLLITQSMAALVCFLILAPLALNSTLGLSLVHRNVDALSETADCTIKNNIDTVMQFDEKQWRNLTTTEKVAACQVIANIEKRYLGIPNELNILLGVLDEKVLGRYCDKDHTIMINIDYIETSTADEILKTIAHECYHSYQTRLCDAYDSVDEKYKDLYVFDVVSVYKENFVNYVSGEEDYEAYRAQGIEVLADNYAESALEDYKEAIAERKKELENGKTEQEGEDPL